MRHNRIYKSILALLFVVALGIGCLGAPDVARADDFDYQSFSDLLDRARSIQSDIDAVKDEYLESFQKSEEARAQKLDAEENLEKTRNDLQAEKDKLSQIAIGAYKTTPGAYIDTLLGARDLKSFLDQLSVLNMMAEKRGEAIAHVEELEEELAEIPPKLAEKEQLEMESAATAEEERKKLDKKLDDLKPELDAMRGALSKEFKDAQGTDRLNDILGYLSEVGELTDTQCSIIQQAYRMTGWGGYDNRCEAWITDCLHAAGLYDFPGYASAWDDCQANMISSDFSQAKPGCLAFGSGVGVPGEQYSHVGLIVFANGDPSQVRICDSACSYNASQTLEEWGKWQTAVNAYTGETGVFGWGYPPGYKW